MNKEQAKEIGFLLLLAGGMFAPWLASFLLSIIQIFRGKRCV